MHWMRSGSAYRLLEDNPGLDRDAYMRNLDRYPALKAQLHLERIMRDLLKARLESEPYLT